MSLRRVGFLSPRAYRNNTATIPVARSQDTVYSRGCGVVPDAPFLLEEVDEAAEALETSISNLFWGTV
jgi:hypothetical protein